LRPKGPSVTSFWHHLYLRLPDVATQLVFSVFLASIDWRISRRKALFLLLAFLLCHPSPPADAASAPQPAISAALTGKFRGLPASFEPNVGQSDPAVRYLSRGRGYSIHFRDHQVDFALAKSENSSSQVSLTGAHRDPPNGDSVSAADTLHMRLIGASVDSELSGEDRLPGVVNYFYGRDPAQWHMGIPMFSKVAYKGVYPGINLVYYGNSSRLEFDFQLAPNASVSSIRLQFAGAKAKELDRNGNLILFAEDSHISFHKPLVYQLNSDGTRHLIAGGFRVLDSGAVGFKLGHYNHSRPLVIDPILDYSTYVGARSGATAIAVDSAGEAFVAGYAGPNMPTTVGAYQRNFPAAGKNDSAPVGRSLSDDTAAFVAKFNSAGTALLYCTYLSGADNDAADAIAVDAAGNAYVAGQTHSADFPVTQGAFQTTKVAHGGAGFITVLNSSGSGLIYSTFLSGSTETVIYGLALDNLDNVYVTGVTVDLDFPVTAGAFQSTSAANPLGGTGFVTKLAAGGQTLLYSTYLGGSSFDVANGIAVDANGDAYIAGGTQSPDFPTTPGAFQRVNKATVFNPLGGSFVSKLNPSGTALVYSTYLDGSVTDVANAIAVDTAGSAYVTGFATSSDFPTTPGVIQPTLGPDAAGVGLFEMSNVFITKLNPAGSGLVYSTFLGGSQSPNPGAYGDAGSSIAVDSSGNAYIVGSTEDLDFPVTSGSLQSQNITQIVSGDLASFVTKVNPTASKILYSTYLTGSGDQSGDQAGASCDCATGVALDSSQNVYVTGRTLSTDFPTTLGTFQSQSGFGLSSDVAAFLTKFDSVEMQSLPSTQTTLTATPNPQMDGQPVTFTATVGSLSGNTPTGTVGFSYQGLLPHGNPYAFGPWNNMALNGAGAAQFTTASLPSGSISVVAYYLGDAKNSPSMGSLTETVTQIPTTTTLTANMSSASYGTPITFTATVVETASGKPAQGSVFFLKGSTSFEQAALNSAGQATWISGAGGPLPGGADQITASFMTLKGAPDQASQGSVTVNVLNAPDFTIAVNPASMSATAGQNATAAILISASNGFSDNVSLYCSGLPAEAACTFSPPNVKGGGSTTLTISLPPSATAGKRPAVTTLISTIVLALLIGWFPLGRRRMHGTYGLIGAATIACVSLSACGGSTAGKPGPPSTSYAVIIQAASGPLLHTVTVNLTVSQP
jgi:Bacterial Ig-like domain (group 3)/Beta-propeller repeat